MGLQMLCLVTIGVHWISGFYIWFNCESEWESLLFGASCNCHDNQFNLFQLCFFTSRQL